MTDVRSQRLAHFVTPDGGLWKVWTTPEGMVTLFKGLVVQNTSAGTTSSSVHAVSGAGIMTIAVKSLAQYEILTWDGWLVLNPGDQLHTIGGAAGVHVWLSGAVLAGPPPVPPQTPVPSELSSPLPAAVA